MRSVHALLLSLVAASTVSSAELEMRHSPDMTDDQMIGGIEENEKENDEIVSLMTALSEQFQRSSEMLQSFFHLNDVDDAVRIVVIEQKEQDPARDRKMACLKAVEKIHEDEELEQETMTFMTYIRSTFDKMSLQVWGGASCEDLDRPELVEQCNLVLKSKDVVQKYLLEGKTDGQVCDIISTVTDLDATDDFPCHLCQRFVQMVDHAVSQDMQQVEQVREIIGDVCDAMPADSMCHTVLKNYDAIVDWVKHGTDSLVVCSRLAICSADSDDGSKIPGLDSEEPLAAEDGALATADLNKQEQSCFFCTHVTGVIYEVNILFPDQLPMLTSLFASVCEMTAAVSKCQEAKANFDRIVDLVQLGQQPREVCVNADFCSKVAALDITHMHGNDKACVYCDAATTVVEVILQEAPEEINQIREYADMICNILGEDSPCHEYVNQMDTVIDSLNKGSHPRDICKMLKYCSAEREDDPSSQLTERSRVGMMRNGHVGNHPRGSMNGQGGRHGRVGNGMQDETAVMQADERPAHPVHPHHGSCGFCSRVATVIHQVNQKSPEKLSIVKTILSNVCQLVPSKFKCDVVDKNFDKIVEMEKEGKHPHEICKLLGLCDKMHDGEEHVPFVTADVKDITVGSDWRPGNETECTYCQFATTVAKIAVEQYGADIREVRAYADMICDMLSKDNPCHIYVKQFDFVIDSITKGMSSKAICVGLKFCIATNANDKGNTASSGLSFTSPISDRTAHDAILLRQVNDAMKASIDGCFFCTQAASVIEVAVAADSSKIAQIRQIADVVCIMLPSESQCQSFMEKFDTVIDSLRKGKQIKAICHDLQYCTADAMATVVVPDMIAVQNHDKGSGTCAYCNGIVTVLHYALDQESDQVKAMREAVGTFCELLPTDDACHNDLTTFDEVVSDLLSRKEPAAICQRLSLCASAGARSDLLSGLLDFTGGDFLPKRCTTCQQNTLLLASVITRPDSLVTFEDEISSVCRLIPESSECELLMKHYDVIIDLLKKKEDAETICTRIGECVPADEEVQEEKSMPVSCLFCELTADVLEHAKDSEKVLREAKATLETMCTVLPPLARCDVLSSKFDDLLSLMRDGNSPSEACHALALCDAEFVFLPTSDMQEDPIVQAFEKGRQSMSKTMAIE
ncbi:unnamed protein product [Peronospora belbahrii]|uniref:Saposin B-type domain-containing protein n=1 Tax=Peronospora belbahrii TaxID=622444 RepID=A0AAU9KN06_9STRA|nr:unnamed protein product [Peronospora belbahrii]